MIQTSFLKIWYYKKEISGIFFIKMKVIAVIQYKYDGFICSKWRRNFENIDLFYELLQQRVTPLSINYIFIIYEI